MIKRSEKYAFGKDLMTQDSYFKTKMLMLQERCDSIYAGAVSPLLPTHDE